MIFAVIATFLTRLLLVLLFLPFSAFDKIFDFKGAVTQADLGVPKFFGACCIIAGLIIEIIMPLGILTGIADRMAAFVMAGYCLITALLWKQFWKPGDFWTSSNSAGRLLFWDFLKNFSLAGGFLLITVGTPGALDNFLHHPLASSHPYMEAYDLE